MNRYPEGLPCWAPGAAEHLAELLTGDECAWEWGGGASSIWLAPRISFLSVMEHDRRWADKIIQGTDSQRCEVHVRDFNDPHYVDLVELCKPQPTLWLIDGYKRINCLELVERKIKEGDIVVMDDALDYAEHLKPFEEIGDMRCFSMPHPYAGTPINQAWHKNHGNTKRKNHAMTKETWVWLG